MTTENNLCVVTGNLIVAEEVFVAGGAEKLLEPLREMLKQFVPDLSTKKSRAEIASFAAKYSKSKTLVDKLGKNLKDEYQVMIKPIDKERKIFKDACDEMRDEARKPLTLWEEEQEKILEEERKMVERDLDWDLALNEDSLFNREREMKLKEEAHAKAEAERLAKEQVEQAEKDRIAYEAKVKAEAEESAKKAAEQELLREQEEKERLIRESEQRELQVKIDAENTEKQRLSDIQAEKTRVEKERFEAAQKAERDKNAALAKQKADQEAKEKIEAKRIADANAKAERKANNLNHVKAVNNKVLKKIIAALNIPSKLPEHQTDEFKAKTIMESILKDKIPQITINY